MTQDVPAWGSPEPEPQPGVFRASPAPSRELACPVCAGTSFRDEEARLETRWAMSHHILTMKVCQGCSYVLFFYQGGGSPF